VEEEFWMDTLKEQEAKFPAISYTEQFTFAEVSEELKGTLQTGLLASPQLSVALTPEK